MKKPKGPGKGVRVSSPLPPGRAAGKQPGRHRHRHQKPGKPHHHHHPGPGGVKAHSPLPGAGKPVHIGSPHHHHHKPPKKPVKRKLALGEGVACCAAEALAASLRLAGVPMGDEDVLALYWRTAADADAGATISATLEAASEFGLAGVRPESFAVRQIALIGGEDFRVRYRPPDGHVVDPPGPRGIESPEVYSGQFFGEALQVLPFEPFGPDRVDLAAGHGLILGVTLPGGPHALTLDPSGAVWSWGELYDLTPDVAIDEAWHLEWGI